MRQMNVWMLAMPTWTCRNYCLQGKIYMNAKLIVSALLKWCWVYDCIILINLFQVFSPSYQNRWWSGCGGEAESVFRGCTSFNRNLLGVPHLGSVDREKATDSVHRAKGRGKKESNKLTRLSKLCSWLIYRKPKLNSLPVISINGCFLHIVKTVIKAVVNSIASKGTNLHLCHTQFIHTLTNVQCNLQVDVTLWPRKCLYGYWLLLHASSCTFRIQKFNNGYTEEICRISMMCNSLKLNLTQGCQPERSDSYNHSWKMMDDKGD